MEPGVERSAIFCIFKFLEEMGCPALGVCVAFLKQPDALHEYIFELLLIN
jgi:hypothetical protein